MPEAVRHEVTLHTDGRDVPATLFVPTVGAPRPAYVFLQGANAEGTRYHWLSGLAERGVPVLIPDLPAKEQPLPGGGGTMRMILPTVGLLDAAARWVASAPPELRGRCDGRVVAGGHSWGGMIAIIGLDAARSATHGFAGFPTPYQPCAAIAGAAVIGAHLQTGDTNPTSPLRAPTASFPALFVAAEHDGLSPAQNVRLSASRLTGAAEVVELAGGSHFQWCSFTAPTDQLARDGSPSVSGEFQKSETIRTIKGFFDRHFPA